MKKITDEENSLIALAQSRYQREFDLSYRINADRAKELYRLGIMGLLEAELETSED